MENLSLLILGIFIAVLGIVNIRGNINTIHFYNRKNVSEEDVPRYGKAVGTGTLIIGVSLVMAYIAAFWIESALPYIIIPATVVGLAFILYGQFSILRKPVFEFSCIYISKRLQSGIVLRERHPVHCSAVLLSLRAGI